MSKPLIAYNYLMYPVVQSPDEILRTPATQVDTNMPGLQKIIEEMRITLILQKKPEGVGLAANQVGLPYKIFLARFTTARKEPIRVFINPETIEHSKEMQEETKKTPLEGCLSLPKYYGLVRRYKWVKVKYFRHDTFEEITETFEDFPAIVIQHEMDHLNGKIFVERILEQKGRIYKVIGIDKQGKDEWEEVVL